MSLKNLVFGDRVLLVIIILLSLFSFFPVFSSSSYLSYVIDGSSPLYYLIKHFIVLLFGFALMFSIKLIPYNLYKGMSIILMPIGVLLLAYTLSKGTIIAGSAASRWIDIPIVGISFQTSSLAAVIIVSSWFSLYFTDTSIKSIFSISYIFLNNSNIVYLRISF